VYDVDVVSGTFKLNFALCMLSYDSSQEDEPPLLVAVSPKVAKDKYIITTVCNLLADRTANAPGKLRL